MGLVDDITLIAEKINEVKAVNESVSVAFTFNQIQAGNDYSVVVTLPDGTSARISSLVTSEITDFLDGLIDHI